MLEKIDLSKKMKKPEYKEEIQTLSIRPGCVWKRSADRQADPGIGPAGL